MREMGNIIRLGAGASFELAESIGEASFGEVLTARWLEGQDTVAIKLVCEKELLRHDARDHHLWTDSLRREIAFLRTIRAPNIVRLLQEGEHDGYPVLVMERLDMSLLTRITPKKQPATPVTLDIAAAWVRQIAAGLDALHGRGLRHLDLKPANILLTLDGVLGRTVRLADFGEVLPADTPRHRQRGTIGWQAPEQFFPRERAADDTFIYHTDHRADFYALGLLLFHMVSGEKTSYAQLAGKLYRQNGEMAAWYARHGDGGAFTEDDGQRFMQSTAGAPARRQEQALHLLRQLLAPAPAQRPANAEAVIALLKDWR